MKLTFAAALSLALTSFTATAEKIEGEAQCVRCSLKKSDGCQTAIVTKKDGTETVYWVATSDEDLDDTELHADICTKAKPVTAEGTVTEKDGKKILKLSKFELKK